ncbi:MAG: hypothetical protein IKQ41_13390 [Clostridia bacterium]|nr:hypothetical protein [Clostridia bacterium]
MKKLLCALAVLALAIVLLPMQEAKANYHRGDTCPKCGQNNISTFWGTTKLHNVWCSNCHWGQELNGDGRWITLESNREPHFGGTATCVKEAKCEGCNTTYGEIDPKNHTNLETFAAKEPTCTESGNNLYYYCKDCKKYLKADKKTETTVEKETIKAFHDWATTLTDGGDTHYYACSRCDAKKDEAAHIYENWTKVDDSNHKGKCACGKEKTEPHSGGTATCQAKAKCADCEAEYGDKADHNWDTAWTTGEGKHWHKCKTPGCTAKKDEAEHSGGTATCVSQATCGVCNQKYGQKDPNNHSWQQSKILWLYVNGTYTEADVYYSCERKVNGCTASKTQKMHLEKSCTATCEAAGKYIFKATISADETLDGGAYSEERSLDASALGHEWETKWTIDGDVHYHACSRCDAKKDEAAHSYGSWTKVDDETHEGTCVCGAKTTGEHVWNGSHWCGYPRKCSVCQEYYGETLGHEFWYEYKTEEQHKINCYHCDGLFGREDHSGGTATCTKKAVCEKCGEEYGDYAHDWGEWHVDPDDSTKHIRTCNNNCGASESHAISWGAWEKVDEENHKHSCQGGCGLSETVAHVWNGSHWCGYPRKCRDCGEFYGDVLDHEFWYEYKTEEQHKINCYHCDGLFGREDHSGGTATCTQKAVCEKCGHEYGALAEHTGGTATCTEKAKCEVCGQEYGEPLGHDLIHHDAQAPTCTAIGWDAYNTCSRCDYTTYEEKAALGHDPVHHDAQAPTCTAIGWDAYDTCSRCDYTTYAEKAALGHDLVHHDAQAPTCTEIGWDAYDTCSRCDYTTYVEKAALGHDLIHHDAQAPTCTAIGWDAYDTCSRCDYTTYVEKAALGHDLVHHDAQAPTCTEIGWDAYDTCSRCDYTTYEEKASLGHDLVHHDAQAPTCTAIGWDAYDTCSRCDYTTYAEKKALGHDLVHHDAQAPTCTAIGWDAYDACSRCDYTTYAEIPALGHDYQITSRTITIITSTCSHCGDSAWTYNPGSRSLLDGLVRDVAGEPVDYSAGVSLVDGKRVLAVTPDPVDGEVGLYLTPEEAELWLKQGIDTVSFSTDFAALEIDLSEITAEWFPLEDGAEIDFFVFTLAPAEDGAEVRAEALIGEEKTPAEAFAGIALFLEDQGIGVTENGVYRKE